MTRVEFAGYLVAGALVGLLAGVFGIGGGLVIVPTLVFHFSLKGLPPDSATHLAVGTSLACMIPTAASSALGHHRSKTVSWHLFRQLAPAIVPGAALGAIITLRLHAATLQTFIGTAVLLFGLSLATSHYRSSGTDSQRPSPSPWALRAGGAAIGCLSAVLGVGGSMMMVPFLNRLGIGLRQAVGTAAACVLPMAVIGTLTHILLGPSLGSSCWDRLPGWRTGLVYWPAFLGVVLMSMPCARLGVWLAARCPLRILRFLFVALLFGVGLKFLAGM